MRQIEMQWVSGARSCVCQCGFAMFTDCKLEVRCNRVGVIPKYPPKRTVRNGVPNAVFRKVEATHSYTFFFREYGQVVVGMLRACERHSPNVSFSLTQFGSSRCAHPRGVEGTSHPTMVSEPHAVGNVFGGATLVVRSAREPGSEPRATETGLTGRNKLRVVNHFWVAFEMVARNSTLVRFVAGLTLLSTHVTLQRICNVVETFPVSLDMILRGSTPSRTFTPTYSRFRQR
jgi:hypothetical protein